MWEDSTCDSENTWTRLHPKIRTSTDAILPKLSDRPFSCSSNPKGVRLPPYSHARKSLQGDHPLPTASGVCIWLTVNKWPRRLAWKWNHCSYNTCSNQIGCPYTNTDIKDPLENRRFRSYDRKFGYSRLTRSSDFTFERVLLFRIAAWKLTGEQEGVWGSHVARQLRGSCLGYQTDVVWIFDVCTALVHWQLQNSRAVELANVGTRMRLLERTRLWTTLERPLVLLIASSWAIVDCQVRAS